MYKSGSIYNLYKFITFIILKGRKLIKKTIRYIRKKVLTFVTWQHSSLLPLYVLFCMFRAIAKTAILIIAFLCIGLGVLLYWILNKANKRLNNSVFFNTITNTNQLYDSYTGNIVPERYKAPVPVGYTILYYTYTPPKKKGCTVDPLETEDDTEDEAEDEIGVYYPVQDPETGTTTYYNLGGTDYKSYGGLHYHKKGKKKTKIAQKERAAVEQMLDSVLQKYNKGHRDVIKRIILEKHYNFFTLPKR